MDTDTKVWTKVASLPEKCNSLTAAILGDRLYLAGGYPRSKSVFTCSLPHLLTPDTLGSRLRRQILSPRQNVWKNACSLPVTASTLVSFSGHLLAVGGRDDSGNPTSEVYRYNSTTDSWTAATRMKKKKSCCLAVTLPDDQLIVVGGLANRVRHRYTPTQSIEILQ